jgi:WD40 repeat protein
MSPWPVCRAFFLLLVVTSVTRAADPAVPAGDGKPVLRLEAGGPTAAVTALAFAPDGRTLYAAGLDKVVRAWSLEGGRFVLKRTFRVPLGPGTAGAINALAVSADGKWLAAGGRGLMQGESDFRRPGIFVPRDALNDSMWLDAGNVYVFDVTNPAGGHVLRGHHGAIRALAFAPSGEDQPLLVSAAVEQGEGKPFGSLRLWDVRAAKTLAQVDRLPSVRERPGLAVWRTGNKPLQMRVAVAWPEPEAKTGYLRLWDPSAGGDEVYQGWEEGTLLSVAALLGNGRVLTGGFGGRRGEESGRLRLWKFGTSGAEEATSLVAFPREGDVHFLPWALVPISSRANGTLDHAAVVLQPSAKGRPVELALVRLGSRPEEVRRLRLPGFETGPGPVLAASPNGSFLAVAGFPDHRIALYPIADLLEGKQPKVASLRGAGSTMRRVAFVTRGKENGLWLSENADAEPLKGGLVFDFDSPGPTDQTGGWKADAPDPGTWSLGRDKNQRWVEVRRDGKAFPRIQAKGKQQLTAAAVLPPGIHGKRALLAVGDYNPDTAESFITLYDVETSLPLWKLTGHLQEVRGLAFCNSRPLLASVAEDQTICLWSLNGLDQVNGEIQGLEVADAEGKVVVRGLESGSPAASQLAKGDVITAVGIPDGKAKAVKSALEYFLAVAVRRPGDKVSLEIANKAAVTLPVGEGIGQRLPLVTLFLTETARDWVGWSPAGPYDVSGPRAEERLGWHTNTGKPEAPTTFADADAYRKEYHRKNLLKYVLAAADLGKGLKAWEASPDGPRPPPEPEPNVSLGGKGAAADPAGPNRFRVSDSAVTLDVDLNPGYPVEATDVLTWRATGPTGEKIKATAPLVRAGENRWQADISELGWRRGDYSFEVVLKSHRLNKSFAAGAVARFQPPAPTLTLKINGTEISTDKKPSGPLTVMDRKLNVEVGIATAKGQEVEVRYAHRANSADQKAPPSQNASGPSRLTASFTLERGANRVLVTAVNKDALRDHEREESAELDVNVVYQPSKEPLPQIGAIQVEPAGEEKILQGHRVHVVDVPEVTLRTAIGVKRPLTEVSWVQQDGKPEALPNKAAVVRKANLPPGQPQTFRFRARTENSDLAEAEITVAYHPPLPRLTVKLPAGGAEVFESSVKLPVELKPNGPTEGLDLWAEVEDAAGKKTRFPVTRDERKQTWAADVKLGPGENRITVGLKNRWREAAEQIRLTHRRPPRLSADVTEIKVGDKPLVNLAATVAGPVDLPPTGVSVNGAAVPREGYELKGPEVKDAAAVWQLLVRDVPVKDGENYVPLLRLAVRNADGECRQPIAYTVVPPPKKVVVRPVSVRFLAPERDGTTQEPETSVRLWAGSECPLKSLELWRDQEGSEPALLFRASGDKAEKVGGRFEITGALTVRLVPGPNRLRLTAINEDGGRDEKGVVLGYVEPPVVVEIDRLITLPGPGLAETVYRPVKETADGPVFDDLGAGLLRLVGRVRWADPAAAQLDDPNLEVLVFVNGARQFPAPLLRRGSGADSATRRFDVPIVMTKRTGNRVEVVLPRVKQERASRREFRVNCGRPIEQQRLHLLIVGVDVDDGTTLKERVLKALGARPPSGPEGEFATPPAFQKGLLYPPLTGYVESGHVRRQLLKIGREIEALKERTGWMNDLVLVYYQGKEVVARNGDRYLLMSLNRDNPAAPVEKFALALADLPRIPGVQVLLLSVEEEARAKGAAVEWRGERSTCFMRYAWQDKEEPRKARPRFLDLLEKALVQGGRLGEVANRLDVLIRGQAEPLVLIPEDLQDRPLGGPGKK